MDAVNVVRQPLSHHVREAAPHGHPHDYSRDQSCHRRRLHRYCFCSLKEQRKLRTVQYQRKTKIAKILKQYQCLNVKSNYFQV